MRSAISAKQYVRRSTSLAQAARKGHDSRCVRWFREPQQELRPQHGAACSGMNTASVDDPDASCTAIDRPLQNLSERAPRLVPVEPVKVDLFIRRNLASPQSSQMSAVDPRSNPLESFRLVAQDFEDFLRHVSGTPALFQSQPSAPCFGPCRSRTTSHREGGASARRASPRWHLPRAPRSGRREASGRSRRGPTSRA